MSRSARGARAPDLVIALAGMLVGSAGACGAIDLSVGVYAPDVSVPDAESVDASTPAAGFSDASLLDANLSAPDATDAMTDAARPSVPASFYIEAESGLISAGFAFGNNTSASGGQFLDAPLPFSESQPGPARAIYDLRITEDGSYVIWGRLRAPDVTHNRFWFQVDDGPWRLWRISTGEIWFWDDLHEDRSYGNALSFALTEGPHRLTFANAVDGVWLDRLYVTSRGDKPPGNTTVCRPPHSIEVAGLCQLSCGAQQGRMCGPSACMGKPLIEAYDCAVCCAP